MNPNIYVYKVNDNIQYALNLTKIEIKELLTLDKK